MLGREVQDAAEHAIGLESKSIMDKLEGFVHTVGSVGLACEFCGRTFGGDIFMHNMHQMQHGRLSGNFCVGKACTITFTRAGTTTTATHANNDGTSPQTRALSNTTYGEPSIDELRSFCDSCHVELFQQGSSFGMPSGPAFEVKPGSYISLTTGETLGFVGDSLVKCQAHTLTSGQPIIGTAVTTITTNTTNGWQPPQPEQSKPKPEPKHYDKPNVKRRLIDLDL